MSLRREVRALYSVSVVNAVVLAALNTECSLEGLGFKNYCKGWASKATAFKGAGAGSFRLLLRIAVEQNVNAVCLPKL